MQCGNNVTLMIDRYYWKLNLALQVKSHMQKMVLLWYITQRQEIKELLRFDVEIRLQPDDC